MICADGGTRTSPSSCLWGFIVTCEKDAGLSRGPQGRVVAGSQWVPGNEELLEFYPLVSCSSPCVTIIPYPPLEPLLCFLGPCDGWNTVPLQLPGRSITSSATWKVQPSLPPLLPGAPASAWCFLLAQSFWRSSHDVGATSQNAAGITLLEDRGHSKVEPLSAEVLLYENRDLVEDSTDVDISRSCGFFIPFMQCTFGMS